MQAPELISDFMSYWMPTCPTIFGKKPSMIKITNFGKKKHIRSSSIESAGFKILLHNPTETPRISDYGILISTGRETRLVVSPKITTASYLVQKVPLEKRRCFFPNEIKLIFFRYCILFFKKHLNSNQNIKLSIFI